MPNRSLRLGPFLRTDDPIPRQWHIAGRIVPSHNSNRCHQNVYETITAKSVAAARNAALRKHRHLCIFTIKEITHANDIPESNPSGEGNPQGHEG